MKFYSMSAVADTSVRFTPSANSAFDLFERNRKVFRPKLKAPVVVADSSFLHLVEQDISVFASEHRLSSLKNTKRNIPKKQYTPYR